MAFCNVNSYCAKYPGSIREEKLRLFGICLLIVGLFGYQWLKMANSYLESVFKIAWLFANVTPLTPLFYVEVFQKLQGNTTSL